jgi:hypothetical protein
MSGGCIPRIQPTIKVATGVVAYFNVKTGYEKMEFQDLPSTFE